MKQMSCSIRKNLSSIYLILALLLVCFSSCDSKRTIVNGLDEKEANEILVFLAGKNIDAVKVASKAGAGPGAASAAALWDIAVDSSKATEAMAILNANGLPRRRGQNLLGLFSAGGLVPSETQEQIRYRAGLAEQIASTIRKIDGVLDADIQLSFPEEDPLNPAQQKSKVTASVYVKHSGVLDDPNSHLITKIKRLVGSSVNGLDYDNVTVISDKARFADVNIESGKAKIKEKMDFVRLWSLVIAKDSVTRFQVIFFSFCIIILIFFLIIVWLLWKLFPVLKAHGGITKLFVIAPLAIEHPVPTQNTEATDALATPVKDEPKGPKVQENIESS